MRAKYEELRKQEDAVVKVIRENQLLEAKAEEERQRKIRVGSRVITIFL